MAREKNKLKWEPTQKLKHPDGIKSSDFSNAKPFIPSYETESRPEMGYLMSMEYARIWKREKEELDKTVAQDTKNLQKRFVVRGPNKKKQDIKKESKENLKVKKNIPKQK